MAFTITEKEETVFGNKRVAIGVYTNDGGSTGGDIATGLTRVLNVTLQPQGSAVSANQPVVNETFPLSSGDVTIVTSSNEVGTFYIIGE